MMDAQTVTINRYKVLGFEVAEDQPARGITVMVKQGPLYVSILKDGSARNGNLLEGEECKA